MCDYCSCRSETEIAALSADHERLKSITAAMRRSDGRALPGLTAELAGLLRPHALREEQGVFAELRRAAVPHGYVARFEDDHAVLDGLLDRCDEPGVALALADALDDHILREESDLFPAAHQLLSPDAWEAVEAVSRSEQGAS